jgi:hypothetical protein
VSSWPPLALAVWLGVSGACLAAESRPAGEAPAVASVAVDSGHHLSLNLPLRALEPDGSASAREADRAEARADRLEPPAAEVQTSFLDLHLGRTSQAGRRPGDTPPLYGEVGIDVDVLAGLSLEPSYRMVLNEDTIVPIPAPITQQVLKLDARIPF